MQTFDPAPGDDLWAEGMVRVFASHISQHAGYVAEVAGKLSHWGLSCFIAHQDIAPSTEWVIEIERALGSAHVLLAFLHEGFYESDWTEQEVGIALGRSIPVISLRLGAAPRGFTSRIQAIPGRESVDEMAWSIFETVRSAAALQGRLGDAYVAAVASSPNYAAANDLGRAVLTQHGQWTTDQVERLVQAAAQNPQVRESTHGKPAVERLALEVLGVEHDLDAVFEASFDESDF